MKIDIVTLFPDMCAVPLGQSIMKRAQNGGHLDLQIHNLRDWTTDKHRQVDDEPFGGGPGMVMKPEPFFACANDLATDQTHRVLLTPQGSPLRQALVRDLSTQSHLLLFCGHYEGVDHRVVEHLIDQEISLGDYVLTNGAIAATVLVDAVVRLLPGVLGDPDS
ncbi:MAG: tRNA (guanosine(37)-N1)-methyltransferase TrmD, partial [Verrucomicrobiota bacterium]